MTFNLLILFPPASADSESLHDPELRSRSSKQIPLTLARWGCFASGQQPWAAIISLSDRTFTRYVVALRTDENYLYPFFFFSELPFSLILI